MSTRVSVIIPQFCAALFLRQAHKSLFGGKRKNQALDEVILANPILIYRLIKDTALWYEVAVRTFGVLGFVLQELILREGLGTAGETARRRRAPAPNICGHESRLEARLIWISGLAHLTQIWSRQ